MEWTRPSYYEQALALPYPLESTIPTGPGDVPERPHVPEKESWMYEPRHVPDSHLVPEPLRVPRKKRKPLPPRMPSSSATLTLVTDQHEPASPYGVETLVESFRESEDPCAALRHFNTMLLIDDSAHMEEHWTEVKQILDIIAPVLTMYDPNGIDIEFINYWPLEYLITGRRGYTGVVTATGNLELEDNVEAVFAKAEPKGKCRMDRRLRSILEDYVEDYKDELSETGQRMRPLNLIVVTSGIMDKTTPYYTLVKAARELDQLGAPPYQLGIQFFQVGREPEATLALQTLDRQLHSEEGVRDIVDTVTWTGGPGELSPGALLKTILGAVKRSIDKMAV
ncbi:hypothetical protein F4810DRAFT_669027 [Camillea tinctor]|nr:hypothetical protein F4810DRAFT_669027 [Camillea tinctor]